MRVGYWTPIGGAVVGALGARLADAMRRTLRVPADSGLLSVAGSALAIALIGIACALVFEQALLLAEGVRFRARGEAGRGNLEFAGGYRTPARTAASSRSKKPRLTIWYRDGSIGWSTLIKTSVVIGPAVIAGTVLLLIVSLVLTATFGPAVGAAPVLAVDRIVLLGGHADATSWFATCVTGIGLFQYVRGYSFVALEERSVQVGRILGGRSIAVPRTSPRRPRVRRLFGWILVSYEEAFWLRTPLQETRSGKYLLFRMRSRGGASKYMELRDEWRAPHDQGEGP